MAATNERTGKPLSASTVHATLAALKAFFVWLADQRGYALAHQVCRRRVLQSPRQSVESSDGAAVQELSDPREVRAMIEARRADRNRATRPRADRLRDPVRRARSGDHLISAEAHRHRERPDRTRRPRCSHQAGEDFHDLVLSRRRRHPADRRRLGHVPSRTRRALGPTTRCSRKRRSRTGDDLAFRAVSLDRAPWANANPVREIFRGACARAGLPYFNPHLLRNTLVQVAYDLKLDAESFKAWSQNLGHESCLTTFSSYGTFRPPGRRKSSAGSGSASPLPTSLPTPNCCVVSPIRWKGAKRPADR